MRSFRFEYLTCGRLAAHGLHISFWTSRIYK
jgi:hypothetical protein